MTPGVCVGGRRYAVWSRRRRNIFVASRSNGQLFAWERSILGVYAARGMSGFGIERALGLKSYSDLKNVFGIKQVLTRFIFTTSVCGIKMFVVYTRVINEWLL